MRTALSFVRLYFTEWRRCGAASGGGAGGGGAPESRGVCKVWGRLSASHVTLSRPSWRSSQLCLRLLSRKRTHRPGPGPRPGSRPRRGCCHACHNIHHNPPSASYTHHGHLPNTQRSWGVIHRGRLDAQNPRYGIPYAQLVRNDCGVSLQRSASSSTVSASDLFTCWLPDG